MAFDEGAMIVIDFTQEAIEALDYQRYHHPHPRVQRKMEALWLKSQGLPHHQIAALSGISPNTLRAYLRQYQAGGIEALKQLNYHLPEVNCRLIKPQLKIIFGQIHRRLLKRLWQKSMNSPVSNAVKVVYGVFLKA